MIQDLHSFGYYNHTMHACSKPVNFTGMSQGSQYRTSFDFIAAKMINNNTKKWQLDGSWLSAANISKAMEKLFMLNKVFGPYKEANPLKIAWKNYIPQDVREYCADKVNEARAGRLRGWQKFLENPESNKDAGKYKELVEDIKSDKALSFVIWNAVNSELQVNNRHIPVPFDIKALDETVRYFKNIEPKFRAVVYDHTSFIEMYTHRLRDNLLMEKGLSDNDEVWVRIPSIKKDPQHKDENVSALEILSYKNWCTRSSLDKAEAALEDGDFHVYLKRDKEIWKPLIGMASARGKIDQIQGTENNNFIPLNEIGNVKEYLRTNGLKCQSAICSEGPKALQQIMIADTLLKTDPVSGKTFSKAIKDNDTESIFRMLGKDLILTGEDKYTIDSYRPQFLLNKKSGITVPYSFLGIDEDALLENVAIINGDLILNNKNPLFNSTITKFPPNLKMVSGRVYCDKDQYEKFKDDIIRVARPGFINIY